MFRRLLIFNCLFTCLILHVRCQENYWILDRDTVKIVTGDSSQVSRDIQKYLGKRVIEGYAFAQLDSVIMDANSTYWYLYLGEKEKLRIGQVSIHGEEEFSLRGEGKSPSKVMAEIRNRGYPFATWKFLDLRRESHAVTVDADVDLNDLILFDTLFLIGDHSWVKQPYLWRYFQILPGAKFQETKVEWISAKGSNSNIFRLREPPELVFINSKAIVYLDLQKKQFNAFQGVLGIQPDDGSPVLVGNMELELGNLFRAGNRFSFSWDRFNSQSQSLSLSYDHPYLFLSGVGAGGSLQILRQDSLFSNRELLFYLSSDVFSTSKIRFRYSRVGGTDLIQMEDSISGFTTDWWGLELGSGTIPVDQVGTKGLFYKVSFDFGIKKLLDPFPAFPSAKLNSYRNSFFLEARLPFARKSKWVGQINGGWIENDLLFSNELYRLGGLNSLRGFNEKQFFTSRYLVERFEYRFFFEERSYLVSFADLGQLLLSGDQWHSVVSGGAGLSISTNGGIFNFVFALGSGVGKTLSLNQTIIHFGYKSEF